MYDSKLQEIIRNGVILKAKQVSFSFLILIVRFFEEDVVEVFKVNTIKKNVIF